MKDILRRIQHINDTHELEEPIFRDWLNGIYLQDIQSSQLEILTGAIERAFQAQLDGTLAQSHVDDVINSRKALKKPNLTEKSLESEALYFRHCLLINFVIGLGTDNLHPEANSFLLQPYRGINSIYDYARGAADYVMPMYYSIDTQIVPILPTPSTTVTFLDPSGTMTNKLIQQRKVVTGKAALAVRAWAGQDNYERHYAEVGTDGEHKVFGILTDAGKANLRAAIETADPTRVEQENDNE